MKLSKRTTFALALAIVSSALAVDRVFPPDAVIDVATYGAIPDDAQDDTAAIQRAITEHVGTGVSLYFRPGVYDISDSLVCRSRKGKWEAHLTFQGTSQEKTILRLADDAKGFGDPKNAKAIILTGSHWNEGDDETGGGNKAFQNYVFDLAIDTGSRNPGAIGIEWAASNWAAIERVTVRSGDRSGVAGIAMKRNIPGPAFIKHVTVDGFDVGIETANIQYGLTIEHTALRHQRVAGVRTDKNLLHIRKLTSEADVPGVVVSDEQGALVLLDSTLAQPPIVKGTQLPRQIDRLIPVEETPEYWNADLADWSAVGPRRQGEPDDTAAIQRAIDAGKSTVYFPIGRTYFLSDTIIIRGNVRQVLGMGAEISLGAAEKPFSNIDQPRPLFRIDPTAHDTLHLENLFLNAQYAGSVMFENNSPAILVIRHSGGWIGSKQHKRSYQNTARATGKVFVEDCFLPGWSFKNQKVFARQFNPENQENADGSIPQVLNDGGQLWILGFKTEGQAPFIVTRNGITEVFGAYNYISATVPPTVPEDAVPYVFENARGSLSFVADNYRDSNYRVYVRATTADGSVREWRPTDLRVRPNLHRSVVVPWLDLDTEAPAN
jgi:hypothetical protein